MALMIIDLDLAQSAVRVYKEKPGPLLDKDRYWIIPSYFGNYVRPRCLEGASLEVERLASNGSRHIGAIARGEAREVMK
jgi:hypothetical protein